MKPITSSSIWSFMIIAIMSLVFNSAQGAGLLTTKGIDSEQLQIKSHHVNVDIHDGYATTTIEQSFYNPSSADKEALYSFPVPEKAAVAAFSYWIGGKEIQAEVVEKNKAREIYEYEKSQGRSTAITEKDAYRDFEISVYPVRAQQDVKIKLVYLQPVHVDSAVGRYVYPLEEGGVDTEQLSFWHNDDSVKEAFSFNLNLRSSYPVAGLRLPQHPAALIQQSSQQEWAVSLESTNQTLLTSQNQTQLSELSAQDISTQATQTGPAFRLDKDIVVYWKLQQGLPGSVDMLTYREAGQSKGTFMLTVTPGEDLNIIEHGRDWVFVLDISGSMQGKYQTLVEGVKRGLSKVHPNDRYRFVLFNDRAHVINRQFEFATPENIAKTVKELEQTQPHNGTNLYAGLRNGLQTLDADRATAVVLVTDGVANVGTTEKKAFWDLLEQHDVRLFTFILGNSANRPLLDGMANISNGFAQSISNSDDIEGQMLLAANKLTHSAMHDIDIQIKGVKTTGLTPERISSVYAGEQLIVFGHYWGEGEAKLTIDTKISGQDKQYKSALNFPKTATLNPELERLWAYANIEQMQAKMDYYNETIEDKDTKQAITDIAIEYGLVTNYTSMLVVQEEVFEQLNIERRNNSRVEKERDATTRRNNSEVQNYRQDSAQPAFTGNRSNPSSGGGGGGSLGLWLVIFIAGLAMLRHKHY